MKAAIQLYKSDGKKAQGYPIKLILTDPHGKRKRKTLSYAQPADWDAVNQLPLNSHEDWEDLLILIMEIRKKAAKLEFMQIQDLDTAANFLLGQPERKKTDFYKYAQERIDAMKVQGRDGNAESYEQTIIEFKKFVPDLNFKDITPGLLQNFKTWKISEGKSNATIKKYLVTMRAIYNYGTRIEARAEDLKPFVGLFGDIPVKRRRARNRYLTKESIKALEALEISHKSYRRAIDLSLLQFYLGGADLVDIYYLRIKDISGARIWLTRHKLGRRGYEFDVMLVPKARAIIEKYRQEDGHYIFPWRKDYMGYKTFRNNHNRNLKIIQKRYNIETQPRPDYLTSKVMRHTFATLGKFAHFEEDLLRELMGHERADIDTAYKDKYPEAERDAAQLKIIS
jgi:integrase